MLMGSDVKCGDTGKYWNVKIKLWREIQKLLLFITRHVDQDWSADEPLRIGGDASVLAGIIVLDSVKNERSVDVFDVWRPDQ